MAFLLALRCSSGSCPLSVKAWIRTTKQQQQQQHHRLLSSCVTTVNNRATTAASGRHTKTVPAYLPLSLANMQKNSRHHRELHVTAARPFPDSDIAARKTKSQHKLTVEELAQKVDLHGTNILLRVDLNVPLASDNVTVTDDTRLRAIVPTARFLLDHGANVLLCSHFGRPKGVVVETGKNGRLTPVVEPLQTLLQLPVQKMSDCVGPEVEAAAANLSHGQVLLLENTRFHAGETNNDPVLASALGRLADYFVNDAFGTAHRAHSSTAGVCAHMKWNAAGFLMQKELQYLQNAVVQNPQRPLMAIVGGAKVSTKLPVLHSLVDQCNVILLGGGMIFTFYKAMGYNIGASLVEGDMIPLAKHLIELAEDKGVKLLLPSDVVVADAFDNAANTAIAKANEISGNWRGLDIGPDTIELFHAEIEQAATIIWNGPMGVFEMSNFAAGTNAVAQMLAQATQTRGAITVVGGGDSVAAMNQTGLSSQVSHISTGGGASLELLEGKSLPGVEALSNVDD